MPEPLRDATGCLVPESIRQLWENTAPIQRMLRDLGNISVALRAAKETNDPQYQECNLVMAIGCVEQLKAELERAIPYVVCPFCQGKLKDNCKVCKGRGAISKFLYDSPAVTQGLRKLRSMVKK